MSDQTTTGNGQAATGRQFGLLRVYMKDVSFEAPNVPEVFALTTAEPDIKLKLRTTQRTLGEGQVEVVLHVASHATAGDRTIFLVEVQQAGVFQVSGFDADEARTIVGIACPNALFPYAREAVSSLVQRGGFPPLYLQPIDFAALYAQQAQQQAAAAPQAGHA